MLRILLAGETRLALLHVRAEAFLRIFTLEELLLKLALERQRVLEGNLPAALHGALDPSHRFGGAVQLWSITDDPLFGPAAAVDALAAQFSAARVQRHCVDPADLGVQTVGHFGPFRRDLGARLWPRLLSPIEAATPRLAARFPTA